MGKLEVIGNSRVRARHTIPRAGGAQLPGAILALSPLGYWKLNDTSGTTAVDSSGNGRNGTYSGSFSLASKSGSDGGLYTDFTGGHVEIANDFVWSANNSNGLTWFAIAFPDTVSASRMFIISKGGSGSAKYEWQLNLATTGVSVAYFTGAGATISTASTTTGLITQSQWNVIAANGPTPSVSCDFDIFINSTTDVAGSPSSTGSGYSADTSPVRIAARADNAATVFDGGLAHVAVFATEINIATLFAAADADGWF